ncbi:MAG TPA: Gfo/Idh/MocA family oxidoreductase [Acidimicrobiia bacterium]|nr:Gfo/Idh/MocA family oxidoreductase [Acidimicrobiia bacterium]
MTDNPVAAALGRPLRLAVVGGGPGSNIGSTHRIAARIDDRFVIVAGVLSSDPNRSLHAGAELGIPRAYGAFLDLLDAERAHPDGAEVVAIMTPNDSHHEIALAALDRGFDVICDKPLANTLGEASEIVEKVRSTGLVLCLTHNYSGYPLVRQARAMVEAGDLGEMRLVQVEYVQGNKAGESDPVGELPWRYHPVRGGPSLVMGDIGTHAHHLVRYVTSLEVVEVAAEVGAIVPNRKVHDFAGAMLRFDNGARGSFWVTQAAAGMENCLRIRASGTKGTIEWSQEQPTVLSFRPLTGAAQTFTPNGAGISTAAARVSRIGKGHPEGFHEAFANIYSDAAEAIAARRTGTDPNPLAMTFPTAEDGAIGLAFVEATIESSRAGGAWTKVPVLRAQR